jgi:uncharacterized protein (TIGR02722 family)
MQFRTLSLFGLVTALGLAGCASTVNRVDPNTVTDLSGDWNDTDARLVAEEMITKCVSSPWLANFKATHSGTQPVLIVGAIRNRSNEHIDVSTFSKDMERELINSGMVRFVSSSQERMEIRSEREDQQENASAETMKKMKRESGADYMLIGNISEIEDIKGGTEAKSYQINLELHNLETNDVSWINTKNIKKMIKRSSARP